MTRGPELSFPSQKSNVGRGSPVEMPGSETVEDEMVGARCLARGWQDPGHGHQAAAEQIPRVPKRASRQCWQHLETPGFCSLVLDAAEPAFCVISLTCFPLPRPCTNCSGVTTTCRRPSRGTAAAGRPLRVSAVLGTGGPPGLGRLPGGSQLPRDGSPSRLFHRPGSVLLSQMQN